MNKELITNEQAIILKQLGFSDRCHFYCENNKLKFHKHEDGWGFNHSFLTCYSKPTYSQVFKWFRDKHDLSGIPDDESFTIWRLVKGVRECILEEYPIETFSEAESKCLDKLIEKITE